MDLPYDELLCSFLERFPTYQLRSKPRNTKLLGYCKLSVFSSKEEEGYQNNPYSSSDDVRTRMMIHDMVISAFSKVKTCSYYIVQLWSPVTIGGRQLLSTYRQPFAVRYLYTKSEKHRLRCEKYGYNINVNNESIIDDNEQNCWPEIRSSGPPLSAFLNGLPEILSSVHQKAGPLLGYGYEESELMSSLLIPIFHPSGSSSSDCIGVVECFLMEYFDIMLFSEMNKALEEVGLRVFNVQDRIPYKTISGLKHTRDEIQKALEAVCESHHIHIAQVWISYEDDTQMKQKLVLKLTGYISSYGPFPGTFLPYEGYYDACDMIPLTMRDELVLKTFQDCEARYCEACYDLDTDILLTWIADSKTECSGLTICMRSIDTSDFEYAFEFIWCHDIEHVIFLEGLLMTLKRCLPCFKFATGAELGDELDVIDVNNSTESETKRIKIFQENRLLPTPEGMEKGKKVMVADHRANREVKCKTAKISLPLEVIKQQFGNTMKVAAENLQVSVSTLKRNLKAYRIEWQGPDSRKRKFNDSFNNQNGANEKNYGAIQDPLSINRDENTLTIKAEYAGDTIKFDLPVSEATFDTVKKEIFTRFDLTVGTYKLKYRDEDGDLIALLSDKDMVYYMKSLKKLNQKEVRLCVCPGLALGVGWVDQPRAS